MYASFITVAQLAAATGQTIEGTDATRAEAVIACASALARHESQRTYVDETTGVLSGVPDAVLMIVMQASIRGYLSPIGVLSETTGSVAATWNKDSSIGVYFTADEMRILRNFRRRSFPGIRVIQITGLPYDHTADADVHIIGGNQNALEQNDPLSRRYF